LYFTCKYGVRLTIQKIEDHVTEQTFFHDFKYASNLLKMFEVHIVEFEFWHISSPHKAGVT